MVNILASLKPAAISELLRLELMSNLESFRNFSTSDELFDYLWDFSDDIDFVVMDNVISDVQDLKYSCMQMPETRFIVIGLLISISTDWPDNITLLENTSSLKGVVKLEGQANR